MKNRDLPPVHHELPYRIIQLTRSRIDPSFVNADNDALVVAPDIGSSTVAREGVNSSSVKNLGKRLIGGAVAPKGLSLLGVGYHTMVFSDGISVDKVFHSVSSRRADVMIRYEQEARSTALLASEYFGDMVPETNVRVDESPVRYPGGRRLIITQPHFDDIVDFRDAAEVLDARTLAEHADDFLEREQALVHETDYVTDLLGIGNLVVNSNSPGFTLLDTGLLHRKSLSADELMGYRNAISTIGTMGTQSQRAA